MNFHLETLEFDKILKQISSYTKSDSSKESILSLRPLFDKDAIHLSQLKILDAMDVIVKSGNLNLISDYDIKDILSLIKHKRLLTIKDIQYLRLFIVMSHQIKDREHRFKKENISLKELNVHFENISTFDTLLTEIDSIIDPDGIILDNASDTLYKLRREIKRITEKRKDILNQLLQKRASILNESMLVLRNDRYCLPVKTEFKNQIKGVIHDVSASGTTTYIEPLESYEYTTSLITLYFQEAEEIEKIIYILLEEVYPFYEALLLNLQEIITLDTYFSLGQYGLLHNMIKPNLNEEGTFHIIGARHPLIPIEDVVSIDLKISSLKPVLMITGPNTGGKTVALKTLGLLSIMNQSGMLIPAKNANMSLLNGVYADIGDKQSIAQNLSTFSSHMLNIKDILDHAKKGSLLLFDELGSGTDPKEGVSLAKAITTYCLQNQIMLVLTTHYSELKVFAYENPLIENASVKFNDETLEPLYTIEYGKSGSSNALKITKRLGMKQEILTLAEDFLKDKETDVSKVILAFEKKQELLDSLIEENTLSKQKLAKQNDFLKEKIERLEMDKVRILEDTKKESKQLLLKQQKEFNALLQELNTVSSMHEVAKLKHDISKLGIQTEEVESDLVLKVGDNVFIKSYSQNGTITDIKKGVYTVKFGTFELPFKKSDLLKQTVKEVKKITKKEAKTFTIKEAKMELDLRGYRAIDVADAYYKFMDDALLANLKELRIIHGYGTGAVKKALYECLKKDTNIDSTRFGGEYEGSSGVTIVTLK